MSAILESEKVLLFRKNGLATPAPTALKGKDYVMLYFSAHWCPPCRGFTPTLRAFHNKHRDTKKLEVIFVSSDRTDKEMRDYFDGAHGDWLCMRFADAQTLGRQVSEQFGLKTIPTVIVLEKNTETGRFEVTTTCGRHLVGRDFEAMQFPWTGIGDEKEKCSRGVIAGVALFVVCALYSLFYWRGAPAQS